MTDNLSLGGELIALTGRDPGDAIVQATLAQQLELLGVDPSEIVVAHASPRRSQGSGWFTNVRHFERGSFWARHLGLLRFVMSTVRLGGVRSIYARDVITMQIALAARILGRGNVRIIFDCRGDIGAEARLRGTPRSKVAFLNFLQRQAWRRADRVMVVSDSLGRLVTTEVPSARLVVVPNLQPGSLPLLDKPLDRPLVVFAGGAQAWQGSALAVKGLLQLQSRGVDVEVVTRDRDLLNFARANGLATSSGDRSHVLSRLQHATGSWMVRSGSAANSVASPVKLGEALSAGALVIGSPDTWERMADLVEDGLAFVVLEDARSDDLVSHLFKLWAQGAPGRARRLELVQRKWSLQSYRGELEEFFGAVGRASDD